MTIIISCELSANAIGTQVQLNRKINLKWRLLTFGIFTHSVLMINPKYSAHYAIKQSREEERIHEVLLLLICVYTWIRNIMQHTAIHTSHDLYFTSVCVSVIGF